MIELLTPAEMSRVDALAAESGLTGILLMERAGAAVAEVVLRRFPEARRVAVLCGSGNNGGDGFVAARHLVEAGMEVHVFSTLARDHLKGDAAAAAGRWNGDISLMSADLGRPDLIIDGLLGAGLSRDVDGCLISSIDAVNAAGVPVIAIDLPSGVDGATGRVRGCAVEADVTVTFARLKPGHLLLPGRQLCGERVLVDIGIAADTIDRITTSTFANRPTLWRSHWPTSPGETHKYKRGHVGVAAGSATSTGASRLVMRSAFRMGAGVVTALAPTEASAVLAPVLEGTMLRIVDTGEELQQLVADRKISCVAVGPGTGLGEKTRRKVLAALATDAAVVVDADGLSSFEGATDLLVEAIKGRPKPVALTPHSGEFDRLFRGLLPSSESKLNLCREAARFSGAVIAFKGSDTVVASPDGRAAIADNAPSWLATAGSGDVLAGAVAGLLAQGMPAFEAVSAAVWIHGRAAADFGPGLIAEDLPDLLPPTWRRFSQPWTYQDPLNLD